MRFAHGSAIRFGVPKADDIGFVTLSRAHFRRFGTTIPAEGSVVASQQLDHG
jgi:hypothetical protein